MGILSAKMKCCATCQFWDGPRKLDAFKKNVEVYGAGAEKGTCTNRRAANASGKQWEGRHAANCGSAYQKWEELP